MKKIFPLLLLPFLLLSCSTNNSSDEFVEGEFVGLFTRVSPNAFYVSSQVTLTLKDGRFEGTSSIQKYPAICRGTYEVSESELFFENECPWTAEFDWRYILSGTFNYSNINGELRIGREYDPSTSDTYILTTKD